MSVTFLLSSAHKWMIRSWCGKGQFNCPSPYWQIPTFDVSQNAVPKGWSILWSVCLHTCSYLVWPCRCWFPCSIHSFWLGLMINTLKPASLSFLSALNSEEIVTQIQSMCRRGQNAAQECFSVIASHVRRSYYWQLVTFLTSQWLNLVRFMDY